MKETISKAVGKVLSFAFTWVVELLAVYYGAYVLNDLTNVYDIPIIKDIGTAMIFNIMVVLSIIKLFPGGISKIKIKLVIRDHLLGKRSHAEVITDGLAGAIASGIALSLAWFLLTMLSKVIL